MHGKHEACALLPDLAGQLSGVLIQLCVCRRIFLLQTYFSLGVFYDNTQPTPLALEPIILFATAF